MLVKLLEHMARTNPYPPDTDNRNLRRPQGRVPSRHCAGLQLFAHKSDKSFNMFFFIVRRIYTGAGGPSMICARWCLSCSSMHLKSWAALWAALCNTAYYLELVSVWLTNSEMSRWKLLGGILNIVLWWWVRVTDESYQQNASLIEGMAHIAGPTSGPAGARGAVYSVVKALCWAPTYRLCGRRHGATQELCCAHTLWGLVDKRASTTSLNLSSLSLWS